MTLISTFILLLFISATAWGKAASCQTVDMRAEFGPPRSQGNVGWCYANTAADLLSHHYRAELKSAVSAVDIALNFNHSWTGHNFREGGFMFLALYDAINSGGCPIELDHQLFGRGVKQTLREKINFVLDLKTRLDKGEVDFVLEAIRASQKEGSLLKELDAYHILSLMTFSKPSNVLITLADHLCKERRHQFSHRANIEWSSVYTGSSSSRLLRKINEQLDRRNPVGVAYYASFFDHAEGKKSGDDRHMSVVVGRKFDKKTNTCEYLIRNSWGKNCHGYKNKTIRSKCEEGNIWVSEQTLSTYIYGVTYLQ